MAIGIAGMIGAILRTTIGVWVGEEHVFPIITFSINLIATWILCFLATGVLDRVMQNDLFHEAVTVGFLGSFSTFATFSIETVLLIESGHIILASLYICASIIGGLCIGYFGFFCGRKWKATW